jgi:hypothetical protein
MMFCSRHGLQDDLCCIYIRFKEEPVSSEETPYDREHFTYDCPLHGSVEDRVCCIPVRIQGRPDRLAVTPGTIKLEALPPVSPQE